MGDKAKKVSIVIQGEGKGHFSQALETIRLLEDEGTQVRNCYLGVSLFRKTPQYFREELPGLKTFQSPNFLRTPDQKGIVIMASLLINMVLSPVYLLSIFRLGILLARDRSASIINFYDPLGGLAAKWFRGKATRIAVSHHFYLSHPDFIHPHGLEGSFFWLQLMNRVMLRSATRVLALSFRKGGDHGKIRVVPPIISRKIREAKPSEEGRDVCYFLNPGFVTGALEWYGAHRERSATIFGDAPAGVDIPANVSVVASGRHAFQSALSAAERVICTAGFDTVAEAFYLGKPVYIIPSKNHYEQYCNALDAARTGMAFQLEEMKDLDDAVMEKQDYGRYREWVDSFSPRLFNLPYLVLFP